MKKVLLWVLAMTMLFITSASAEAKEIDLSVLSNDELILLRSKVETEINARGIETNSLIYDGVYFVGQDIKAGQYTLTVVDSAWSMGIILFETKDTYDAYFKTKRFSNGEESAAIEANAKSRQYIDQGNNTSLNLRDGMILMLKNGTGRLEASKPSWAP